jgi:hypothetical protein
MIKINEFTNVVNLYPISLNDTHFQSLCNHIYIMDEIMDYKVKKAQIQGDFKDNSILHQNFRTLQVQQHLYSTMEW